MALDGPTLAGRQLSLRPFSAADITPRYLGWLADPEVNRYSRRRDLPPETSASAARYLADQPEGARILAIHLPTLGHVGNIRFEVDRANNRADISIVVGEPAVWGRGVGTEAIYLVTCHLFVAAGVHRVDAGTCNPAFARAVLKLGWRQEGVQRQRVRLGGTYHDYVILAQLAPDFRRRAEYEFGAAGDASP